MSVEPQIKPTDGGGHKAVGASNAATHSQSSGAPLPELVIKPPSRFGGIGFRELWDYHELLYFLTKRELQIRYKQSLFGVGWAVLQPVALAFIFAVFFGRLAGIGSYGLPYPVFALAGLVPWVFVSGATLQAAQSLVTDANLISKIYFPRLVIPLARIASLLVDLILALVVLAIFAVAWDVPLSLGVVGIIGFLLLALVTAVAAGTFFAALNVRYRDVTVAVPLLVQIWLFATPVIYPATFVTGAWRYLYAANPMVSVSEGVRWTMLGTPAPLAGQVAISSAVALLGAFVAIAYFRRTERFFADII
jgi:homopolymeric O-antigen transport system permease protein